MTLTRGLIIAIFVAFVSARSSPTVAAAVLPQQSGQPSVRVGDCLPAVALAATNGTTVLLTDSVGRVKLISVVPQLNTPVCDEQTHRFSEQHHGLDRSVEIMILSTNTTETKPDSRRRLKSPTSVFSLTTQGLRSGNRPVSCYPSTASCTAQCWRRSMRLTD